MSVNKTLVEVDCSTDYSTDDTFERKCDDDESVVLSKYFKGSETKKDPNTSKLLTRICASSVIGGQQDGLDGGEKPTRKDFSKDGIALSKYLLGKIVVRYDREKDILTSGRIVETEAYLGTTDKACHSYGEKKTERTQAMFMSEGTAYVYRIYGMYNCLNISSSDYGGCVLIRALQPLEGIDEMRKNRARNTKKKAKCALKSKQLCSGPAKLCQAMNITKENLNKTDMTCSDVFYVTDDGFLTSFDDDIVVCKRIGINGYGAEAAEKPYRFYLKGNEHVSVRDKIAEKR